MSDAIVREDYHFAWEGADHPDGPWRHLRLLELRGEEAISRPFWFELELRRDSNGADVGVDDLVGARAALQISTRTQPAYRIVHGIIASATELEMAESQGWGRFRVVLRPAFYRAALMRKNMIYLEKTLRQIVDQVLKRTSLGAALEPTSAARPLEASGNLDVYATPKLTYAWALHDTSRIDDLTARPYCVQYGESDFDFVSRLLEEEGISYHFEHGDDESVLVLTDFDGGRISIDPQEPLGPKLAGREVFEWCAGGRLRPRSVHLDDYDWRKPNLDLRAISPSGVTDFTDIVHPGRYDETDAHGKTLAEKREQRFDTERSFATAQGHCRLLSAGTCFRIDHSVEKFSGIYLVTEVRHQGVQRDQASGSEPGETYRQQLGLVRCGTPDSVDDSHFRPARLTPRPRIYGTQTAVVTADPSDPEAEIHLGGPSDLGCVRLRFRWDMDSARCAQEPSSCWVRVSQFFAGGDHGALWHPRVGNEVIVEYLDGDPDRPIVTGRVYNGTNLAPANATQRPTYSAIKSLTSPYDGNYNLIAFEDLQGSEEVIIHAARDWNTNVKRNCTRGVGVDESVHIKGDQTIKIDGHQKVTIGKNQTVNVGITASCTAGTNIELKAGANVKIQADAKCSVLAPVVVIDGGVTSIRGKMLLAMDAGYTRLRSGPVEIDAATIKAGAATITIAATGVVTISGATVNVKGGTVNVDGSGSVNVTGGSVNLNC